MRNAQRINLHDAIKHLLILDIDGAAVFVHEYGLPQCFARAVDFGAPFGHVEFINFAAFVNFDRIARIVQDAVGRRVCCISVSAHGENKQQRKWASSQLHVL